MSASRGKRPHVICHMIATIDGRIVTGHWPDLGDWLREYERTGSTYAAEAWMCGRITMEHFASGVRGAVALARDAATRPAADRQDFVAPGAKANYAVAVDRHGKLVWKSNEIDGDHVVAVLAGGVSDEYLAALRERGVSYLLAGARGPVAGAGTGEVDLALALEKLGSRFGVRTLLLEGGGGINGAMLRAGLIDEVSLLVAPVADGTAGVPSLFDAGTGPLAAGAGGHASRLSLQHVEKRAAGVLWLRYRVET